SSRPTSPWARPIRSLVEDAARDAVQRCAPTAPRRRETRMKARAALPVHTERVESRPRSPTLSAGRPPSPVRPSEGREIRPPLPLPTKERNDLPCPPVAKEGL